MPRMANVPLHSSANPCSVPKRRHAICRLRSSPRRWLVGLGIGLGGWLLAGCRQEPAAPTGTPGSNDVAVVAGRPIRVEAFRQELARRAPGTTPEAVLDSLLLFEATLARARAAGFDREPDTAAALEQLLVARYREREAPDVEAPEVREEEIQALYDAHPERHVLPPAVRGAVLFLKLSPKAAPEQRAALRTRAGELREQSIAGDAATRERLVRENSEDQATRYRGGDTGWLVSGTPGQGWEPAVVEALRSLAEPGDHAPLVETPKGLYLVRLMETRPPATRPLGEVREVLRRQLQREKRELRQAEFRARMLAGLEIRTNRSVFERLAPLPKTADRPPALP